MAGTGCEPNAGGVGVTDTVLGADPDELDAYAQDARSLIALAVPSTSAYRVAWSALTLAPATPPIDPPDSGADQVTGAMAALRTASTSVEGYADALRALDADASGELDSTEAPSADYLDLFLQIREDHTPHDVLDLDWDPRNWRLVSETPEQRLAHITRETDRLWALSESFVDVINDGSDGEPRQIRLDLNDPGVVENASSDDLQQVLELHGIDGKNGPLHFLVHGYTTDTDPLVTAGDSVADLYGDRGEVDTTIVTVDWDSGSNSLTDWDTARANADEAAPALRNIFDTINTSNPDADVKISAHSLGNKVAINALTDMETGSDEAPFQVDYLAIQPAIPRSGYEEDPDDFGALVSDRIKTLTVTVNDGDDALSKYYDYGTIHALGEAEPGDDSITELIEARDELGLVTTVRDHESGLGGESGEGHLGLDPDLEYDDDSGKDSDGTPLRDVYEDQIDR